jgi:hypothetical protein
VQALHVGRSSFPRMYVSSDDIFFRRTSRQILAILQWEDLPLLRYGRLGPVSGEIWCTVTITKRTAPATDMVHGDELNPKDCIVRLVEHCHVSRLNLLVYAVQWVLEDKLCQKSHSAWLLFSIGCRMHSCFCASDRPAPHCQDSDKYHSE